MAKVTLLGTGIMGAGMARNLVTAGHDVRVWNRTRARAEGLGAKIADTPAAAAAGAEVVITMLADGPAVEETVRAADLPVGALWLQTSTVGIAATERLASFAAERGVVFVDAPVMGSKPQAEAGELVILASGPEDSRAVGVLDALSRRVVWLGETGAGTRLKLVANAWILATVANLAEVVALAEAIGVEPQRFFELIEGAAFDMAYAHMKGELMLRREFPASFPLALARKDIALALDAAGGRAELRALRGVLEQFDCALALGHGEEDSSAVWHASRKL